MDIFRDDEDRAFFLGRLDKVARQAGLVIYAWVLMSNHFHWASRTGVVGLSQVCHRVLSPYAQYFNEKYDRIGPLFQDRFRSYVADSERYVYELIRYVHLNPVRAHVLPSVDELVAYRWTSLAALLGNAPSIAVGVDATLELFGDTVATARAELLPMTREVAPDYVPDWDLLGACGQATSLRGSQADDVDGLLARVCSITGVSRTELECGRRTRRVTRARSLGAHALVEVAGLSMVEAAPLLGVSRQALGRRLSDGRQMARTLEVSGAGVSADGRDDAA